MPISSLIVKAAEGHAEAIAQAVDAVEGASVSELVDKNLVVLTETKDEKEDRRIWDALNAIEGVVSVELVYHNFEDLREEKT